MSLIFIDGFDHYNDIHDKWIAPRFDTPSFTAGRFGGQAIAKQFQNAFGEISKDLGGQSEVFFGMANKIPGLTGSVSFYRLRDSSGTQILSVQFNSDGSVSVFAGGNSAVSAGGIITTGGAWHYVECHYIPKDAAGKGGVAEVRVDEIVVASIDGASFATTTGADDDIQTFEFYDGGTNSGAYLYDDFYILNGSGSENNTYLGDVRITVLYPKANGNINTMDPSDGVSPNYEMVDETILDGDTTYVESSVIGTSEAYVNQTFSDIALTPGIIYGVQVCNAGKKTGSGPIAWKNEAVIATIRYSDDVVHNAASGEYFVKSYIRDTDPSDDAAWTEAKVAAVGSALSIVNPV